MMASVIGPTNASNASEIEPDRRRIDPPVIEESCIYTETGIAVNTWAQSPSLLEEPTRVITLTEQKTSGGIATKVNVLATDESSSATIKNVTVAQVSPRGGFKPLYENHKPATGTVTTKKIQLFQDGQLVTVTATTNKVDSLRTSPIEIDGKCDPDVKFAKNADFEKRISELQPKFKVANNSRVWTLMSVHFAYATRLSNQEGRQKDVVHELTEIVKNLKAINFKDEARDVNEQIKRFKSGAPFNEIIKKGFLNILGQLAADHGYTSKTLSDWEVPPMRLHLEQPDNDKNALRLLASPASSKDTKQNTYNKYEDIALKIGASIKASKTPSLDR